MNTTASKNSKAQQIASQEKQRILDVLQQRADDAHAKLNYAEEQRLREALSLVYSI